MKLFLFKAIIFLVITVSVIGVLNRNYFPVEFGVNDSFMVAMIDKHAYANSVKSPRIIFCGGSNLAFGINSKKIADSVGLPVVNLGLHAGLGLDFMLSEVKAVSRPSDIIIFSPEYFLTSDGSYKLKKLAERVYPLSKQFTHLTLRQLINDYFVEDLQYNLSKTLGRLTPETEIARPATVYSRSSYNKYGDVVRNFEPNPSHAFLNNYSMEYSHFEGIELLNNFKLNADKEGIRTYFIYPCFPASLYKAKRKVIEKYADDIQTSLKIKILNRPISEVYNDSLFYNTEYHLIPQGRELRTQKIIKLLTANKIFYNKQDRLVIPGK